MQYSNSGEIREHKRLVTLVRKYLNIGTPTRNSWIDEIIDPMIANKYDQPKLELLVKVALQCVAKDKNERPNINQVVEMLLRMRINVVKNNLEFFCNLNYENFFKIVLFHSFRWMLKYKSNRLVLILVM